MACTKSNSLVGIWWDNGRVIVSFKHLPGPPERLTKLCDSDFNHVDFWGEAAFRLGSDHGDEYYSIPRGRILWNPFTCESIIYHGNATSLDRLKLIAEEFALVRWVAKQDLHYCLGDLTDALFSDDDY